MTRKAAGDVFIATDGNRYRVGVDTNTVALGTILNFTTSTGVLDVVLSGTVTDENGITYTLTEIGYYGAGLTSNIYSLLGPHIRSLKVPSTVVSISPYIFKEFEGANAYMEYINIGMATSIGFDAFKNALSLTGIYSDRNYDEITFGANWLPQGTQSTPYPLTIYYNNTKIWPATITVGGVTVNCVPYNPSVTLTVPSNPSFRQTVNITAVPSPVLESYYPGSGRFQFKKGDDSLTHTDFSRGIYSETYTITQMFPANNGEYSVIYNDIFGFTHTSPAVTLTVNPETVLMISSTPSLLEYDSSVNLAVITEYPPVKASHISGTV